ncbi:hypothetical protein AX17_003870 [Amanita inopinata Kibby_2008]|nr:hypothetical protein AX17_003870 [Amanita inopinata Kibby_2008]
MSSSPFSPFPGTPHSEHKRHSRGSQLPLPPTLSAQSTPRSQTNPNHINGAVPRQTASSASTSTTPTTPQQPRGVSILASRAIGTGLSPPPSPGMLVFSTSPPQFRSTHAGGIQPSVSFFRPSRPNYHDSYTRSSSIASSEDIVEHVQQVDIYPMATLSPVSTPVKPQPSTSTDDHGAGTLDDEHSESFTGTNQVESQEGSQQGERTQKGVDFGRRMLSGAKMKQSREPLLPISGRPGGLGSRSGLLAGPGKESRVGLGASASMSSQQDGGKRSSGGRRMRNSLDRVFNLGRGLSIESIRHSMVIGEALENGSAGRGSPADGQPMSENKVGDEELASGIGSNVHFHRRSSVSPSRHKRTSSSAVGHFQSAVKRNSLSVSLSRHTPISPSPDPSFVSHPMDPSPSAPTLCAVPIKDAKTGRTMRRHEYHPSRNRFFLRGRLLTGGDSPWAFVISFSIALGLAGVWFGTTCVWWWRNESPAVAAVGAYMALIVISNMLATAFTDPGILPRDLDPNPPCHVDGETTVALPRDLRVREDSVRVKYCATCKTYRPPRASHCKMCDNCVDGCDHHCQWVNNCVGRRNYTFFFVLLLTATLTLVLIICTSALHLYLLTRKDDVNFRHALGRAPGSAVAFGMAICIIWPVAALLSYHVRLLLLNITTIEQIRNQAHKTLVPGPAPPNPFTHGSWIRNLAAVLCRPRGLSWLNATGVATEDKRKINPGMYDNLWDGGSGIGDGQNQPRHA